MVKAELPFVKGMVLFPISNAAEVAKPIGLPALSILPDSSEIVLLPMSRIPEAPKLMTVPSMVTPGPPAEIVVPSIEKDVGLAVKVSPPTVYTLLDGSTILLLPMSRIPERSKLIRVPSMLTPEPPAEMMVPSIENAVGLGVKILPPTVYAGLGASEIVPLQLLRIPEDPKLTIVPSMVTPGPPAEIVMPSTGKAVGLGLKTWFPTVYAVGVGKAASRPREMVLLPILKRPEGPKLTIVPSTVAPGPPADIVVPSMENAVGLGVKTWAPMVYAVGETSLTGRDIVLPPISKMPEDPNLIGDPSTVIPGPPAEMVVPSIEKAVGLGVKISPPTVSAVGEGPKAAMALAGAATVIAGAPGTNFWSPSKNCDALFAVITRLPRVNTGRTGPAVLGMATVLPPTITALPSVGTLIRVPETVMAAAPGTSVRPPRTY